MEPSITTPPVARGHSAQVEMRLVVGAVSHRIGILGPDYVFLEAPGEHPPTEADLILEIDGDREESRVFLPKGLPRNKHEVPIRRIPLE